MVSIAEISAVAAARVTPSPAKSVIVAGAQKERGNCINTLSVRKKPGEAATLGIFHHHLLTDDHTRVFAEEFGREVARISDMTAHTDRASTDRLAVVIREIDDLTANMPTGVLSPTLLKLLGEREAEKAAGD
jgi:site-specific DNA recombinase